MSDLAQRLAQLSPEKRALLERRMQAQRDASPPAAAPIAVIGIGCRFPGAADSPQAFWEVLVNGVDAISEVPASRWNAAELYSPDSTVRGKMATRWGGFLGSVEMFDPRFFDITEREAMRMDPQQRLMLEIVWEALEDAGLVAERIAGSATGVFVGAHNVSSDYYVRQLLDRTNIDAYSATGGAHSILANRLSYWLDLRGPSLSVDTACSASLVAVHLALGSLQSGESDLAIAGGANLTLSPEATIAVSHLQMMASDGRCKTFDARADGFVRGEGCGVVILKRLADARRDRDPVYAVIRGSAINQDGRTNGLTAPSGLSQKDVIRRALRQAGVEPNAVGYVEAHGTGTALGDPIEIEALSEVMGSVSAGRRCALGAVKTNIGHLEGAAGIAGLIKTVLCLHLGQIPPNLHFRSLNPHISLQGTRFVIPAEVLEWPRGDEPRFAGVSAFGFGGTNVHAVLEEAPEDLAAAPLNGPAECEVESHEPTVLMLSARSPAALKERAVSVAAALQSRTSSFGDICYTAAVRRTHWEHRLALLATNRDQAAATLRRCAQGERPAQCWQSNALPDAPPTVGFVFSGQGTLHVGVGRQLLQAEPVFREAIERADAHFGKLADWSLIAALEGDDEARWQRTDVAQPLIFAVQLGLAALLDHFGVNVGGVVGHSLGEVAASCVSGTLSLKDAVSVVFHRGRLMQRQHGAGGMAVVAMTEAEARALIAPHGEALTIAAINAPQSITLSGDSSDLQACLANCDAQHWVLPVEYAFHSSQMAALQGPLVEALAGIQPGTAVVPSYSTVRGARSEPADFGPRYWAENVRQPVRFAAAIEAMIAQGVNCFVELSPHPVLSSAVVECLGQRRTEGLVVATLRHSEPEQASVLGALAELHVGGASVDWSRLYPSGGRVARLPSYPWQRHRFWFEPAAPPAQQQAAEPDTSDWFYELAWLLRSSEGALSPRPATDWLGPIEELAPELRTDAEKAHALHRGNNSTSLLTHLHRASLQMIVVGLRQLGFDLQQGDHYSTSDLADVATSAPHRGRLATRLFQILEEDGFVSWDGVAWRVRQTPADTDPAIELARLRSSGPEADRIVGLLARCGSRLADVVRGRYDPLSLLFPDGEESSAEWVYAQASFARIANGLVGDTVAAIVRRLPASRTLRVLELGAGTGGTTRDVLPRLPADRTQYVFTDVSKLFLSQAQQKFGLARFVSYALLDIETDPSKQGFGGQSFDVIIAANVLHATADLITTLRNARALLSPGGTLLVLEGTAPRSWIDLTFGLTEGWWRFSDEELRPSYPLLGQAKWLRLLADAGYAEATAVEAQPDGNESLFEQSLLLATAPIPEPTTAPPETIGPADRSSGPWLILTDQTGIGDSLASKLRGRGTACEIAELRPAMSGPATAVAQLEPGSPESFDRLLEAIAERHGRPPEAVVHLVGLDEAVPERGGDVDWDASIARSCGSALQLFRALNRSGYPLPRGVWIVTRGAQPVVPADRGIDVAQAPLWGLGRVAARELPELWGGLVDLDFDVHRERDATTLLNQIEAPGGENQVVFRSGDRFVARLVPHSVESTAAPQLRNDRSYLVTGGLGRLGLQVARWLVDNGALHLTLIGRRGLETGAHSTDRNGDRDDRLSTIRALEARGASIHIVAADVADRAGMGTVFAAFGSRLPPLAGIVHAAGIMEFESLETIELPALLRRTRAKIAGAWNLHEMTRESALDFLVFFSSSAALGGSPEMAPYAAANHFLDALAHHRRQLGLPALSVNWGLWSERQAQTAERQRSFERIGLRSMRSDMALRGLGQAMTTETVQCTIASVDWNLFKPIYESRGAPAFLEYLSDRAGETPDRNSSTRNVELRDRIEALPPCEGIELLESMLWEEVAAILAVPAEGLVGRQDGFFEMGMDSIMAVELRRRLELMLKCRLPATLAFEYPTVVRLTHFLASEVLSLPIDPETASGTDATVSAVGGDDELDQLSDEELKAVLDDELQGNRDSNTRGLG